MPVIIQVIIALILIAEGRIFLGLALLATVIF